MTLKSRESLFSRKSFWAYIIMLISLDWQFKFFSWREERFHPLEMAKSDIKTSRRDIRDFSASLSLDLHNFNLHFFLFVLSGKFCCLQSFLKAPD